ncbi:MULTISPECIES: argininosuccinate synthase-related protein [Burkholderia]|uniref:argininosuccinate synthase n=1 Tax=Burkholderia paludis TaxID=1506587 RepID=A0A6J5DIB8_9BURK|nr:MULTISPECIES: argininosuccinate synthase-related protein [Burkholderia]CAB3753187.1 Argininosuccinate synthase [Burkholderia paludis]VWB66179.1 argininosuccinate synthase [Burkholderia paludis]
MKTQHRIRSLADLEYVSRTCKHVLTLFSGGVDSSYVLMELAKHRSLEVTALTVDLGDGVNRDDLKLIASHFGAKSLVIDGRQTFARDAVLPALRCNAQYMAMYPISSSLSRPVICRIAVDQAAKLGCDAIVHTANQSQNSLRRLNGALHQLGFDGFHGSPYEYSALTREEKIAELRRFGLTAFQARGMSGDANLWCREFESGSLDNPEAFHVPDELFTWTAKRTRSASRSSLSVRFDQGTPVAIDDAELPLVDLIARLNDRIGSYGIGRYCGLEHLDDGEKVLEVREAPAAHLLMNAYRHLEMATLDPELLREKLSLEQIWVREAIEGRWFADLRRTIDQFISHQASAITGVVKYLLRDGAADVCAIRAAKPRYLTDRDSWEKQAARVRGARSLRELHDNAATDSTREPEEHRSGELETLE